MNALAALKEELNKKRKQLNNGPEQFSPRARPAKRWRSQADIEAERELAYRAQEQKDAKQRMLKKEHDYQDVHLKQLQNSNPPDQESNRHLPRAVSETAAEQKKVVDIHDDAKVVAGPHSKQDLEDGVDKNIVEQQKSSQNQNSKDDDNGLEDDGSKGNPDKNIEQGTNTKEKEEVPECKEDYVYLEIRKYMRLWSSEVEAMSAEERKSNKGRSLVSAYEQTKNWLKPLNKLLKKKQVPGNILKGLRNIFEAVAEREYVRAYSLYLEQLAIGNAPWPMGATMVGIHARAAREKIGEDKIAHVMNDERTRKYIQAIKRLLTVAQRHFPTSPSKMIS